MGHYITVEFPEKIINDNADTLQLKLLLFTNAAGADETWGSENYQLKVLSYGKSEIMSDFEAQSLSAGMHSFVIGDLAGNLIDFFFGNSALDGTNVIAGRVYLYRNGAEYFNAGLRESGLKYSLANKSIIINAMVTGLNVFPLYDPDGNEYNYFNYTQDTYVSLQTIIEDIFTKLNPDNTIAAGNVVIKHNWTFMGVRITDGAIITGIPFETLTQHVDTLYFDPSQNLASLGDLLKSLAADWGALAGAVSDSKCFFIKSFYYDGADTQELGLVLDFESDYNIIPVGYVKITTNLGDPSEPYEKGATTVLESKYIEKKTLSGFYANINITDPLGSNVRAEITDTDKFIFRFTGTLSTPPVPGDTYSNNGSTFEVIWTNEEPLLRKISASRIAGTNNPTASGDLTRVTGSGQITIPYDQWTDQSGTYQIYLARDEDLFSGVAQNHGELLSEHLYNNRGALRKLKVDFFRVVGVTYDFIKNFNYGGYKYQIIRMIIDWEADETEIYALNLGAL